MITFKMVRQLTIAALGLAILFISASATAAASDGYLVDHGVAVYYAVIPAEMIRGHAAEHPEARMHGGIPNRAHVHHVMVALFDAATLQRIVDAEVTATVAEIGLAGQEKKLEPFTVAGALTYGNYFEMRPRTQYWVRVDIKGPSLRSAARVDFEFHHD